MSAAVSPCCVAPRQFLTTPVRHGATSDEHRYVSEFPVAAKPRDPPVKMIISPEPAPLMDVGYSVGGRLLRLHKPSACIARTDTVIFLFSTNRDVPPPHGRGNPDSAVETGRLSGVNSAGGCWRRLFAGSIGAWHRDK